MWFQHDGVLTRFTSAVKIFLTKHLGKVGFAAVVLLSDLSPLEFFSWGEIKKLAYDMTIDSEKALNTRIKQQRWKFKHSNLTKFKKICVEGIIYEMSSRHFEQITPNNKIIFFYISLYLFSRLL